MIFSSPSTHLSRLSLSKQDFKRNRFCWDTPGLSAIRTNLKDNLRKLWVNDEGMGYLGRQFRGTVGTVGIVGVSSGTADIAAAPSEVLQAGLTYKGRMETTSTTAEKQEGGRLKEHRLHLRNKTVIKQQQHIEGTTHACNIFSPKQLKFGSGGRNALKGTRSQR